MSDFLTRLVERTLGLVPVAKPVITPMFAPNILNDSPPDSVWNNESQIANETEPTLARESLSAFSKPELVDEVRLPDTMIGQNDNSTFEPASKAVSPDGLSSYKRLKEDTRGHSEHFTDMISSKQNQRDNPEPKQSIDAKNDSSDLQINSNKLSIIRGDIGTQAVPEVQNTKTYILKSHATERIRSSYVVMPTSSSSTPTIQVTIGRIEVKAITPPVIPAQRSHTHNPILSLDDYLKQRNRRQR